MTLRILPLVGATYVEGATNKKHDVEGATKKKTNPAGASADKINKPAKSLFWRKLDLTSTTVLNFFHKKGEEMLRHSFGMHWYQF